ncbi:MAG: alpha/beta hydrolase [archaeon]
MKRIIIFLFVLLLITSCTEEITKKEVSINKIELEVEDLGDIRIIKNLEYKDNLYLDLYSPKDLEENVPAIIWIHGGAFISGDKEDNRNQALSLVSKGYIVASINYRFSDEAIFPAQIEDVKASVRWLRVNSEKYNINENIGVIGSSAGAYLSAMLGVSGEIEEWDVGDNLDKSSKVQAVVDLFGPVNFETLIEDCIDICVLDRTNDNSPEGRLIGCNLNECSDITEYASPEHYVSSNAPPFLIIHGDEDVTVPYKQSENFYNSLVENEVSAEFILAEGYGHDKSGITHNYDKEIINFFDDHLL